MYNGQFIKGLIHVVIFAVLVSAAHLYGVFGIFIAAWIVYQSFEAYHTARARRDGQPLPDPLGLNEVGNWINPGARAPYPGPAGCWANGPGQDMPRRQGPAAGGVRLSAGSVSDALSRRRIRALSRRPTLPSGAANSAHAPAADRMAPQGAYWGHCVDWPGGSVPVGSDGYLLRPRIRVLLPVLLIGLGVWLIIRRLGESQGGSK